MSGYARHEWIDRLCQHLHHMVVGEGAQRLLDDDTKDGTVVVLPSWTWLVPAIDIGRKARRHDGRAMLMPVRLVWEGGPVRVLAPGSSVCIRWSMAGMGHSAVGSMEIDERLVRTRSGATNDDGQASEPVLSEVRVARGRDTAHALRRLVESGSQARWQATMSLEFYVERAVSAAVRTVSADILTGLAYSGVAPDVLDETGQEQVRDRMLLGTEERPGAVQRLLVRCMAPAAFVRVDPLKYVTTDLRRAAELYVRQSVGDPPIGSKVRRVFRELPDATLGEIIATYRERHPNDSLSVKRAIAALTAGRDAMAGVRSFDNLGSRNTPGVTDENADSTGGDHE